MHPKNRLFFVFKNKKNLIGGPFTPQWGFGGRLGDAFNNYFVIRGGKGGFLRVPEFFFGNPQRAKVVFFPTPLNLVFLGEIKFCLILKFSAINKLGML